jgi:hypothetical protein
MADVAAQSDSKDNPEVAIAIPEENENELGDFGFSSESDVDCCRGCGQQEGHKLDCAFSGSKQ